MHARWFGIVGAALLACPVQAEPAPATILPKKPNVSELLPLLSSGSTDALAGSIRGFLVKSMPTPLYETWPNWGKTTGVKVLRFDKIKPYFKEVQRNDGKWRHIRATAVDPANSVIFDIRDVQQPELGRIVFNVFFAFDGRVEYESQNWEHGIRLYSGGARVRFRAKTNLQCEATYRVQPGAVLLPEAVLRLRVTHAQVSYDNFVTEHINGVGGEAAEMIGDLLKSGLKKFHPSLEQDLLAKANATIEKAADTKEVRLSLTDLIKKRNWLPKAPAPAAPAAPVETESQSSSSELQ